MKPQRSLPPTLRFFCLATIVLCAAMFAAEYVAVNYCHLDRVPYSRMTLTKHNDFADMGMFSDRFDHFHSPEFFSKEWGGAYMYPAPLALIYRFFFYFDEGTNWFLGVAAFLFAAGAVLLFLTLRRSGLSLSSAILFAAVSVAFSYPMYFALNRANMEIFVWMLTGSGVLFFVKERPWWAATLLGIAGACKFYPVFYLGLLLVRRKYWQIVFSLFVGAALSIISVCLQWLEALPQAIEASPAGSKNFAKPMFCIAAISRQVSITLSSV